MNKVIELKKLFIAIMVFSIFYTNIFASANSNKWQPVEFSDGITRLVALQDGKVVVSCKNFKLGVEASLICSNAKNRALPDKMIGKSENEIFAYLRTITRNSNIAIDKILFDALISQRHESNCIKNKAPLLEKTKSSSASAVVVVPSQAQVIMAAQKKVANSLGQENVSQPAQKKVAKLAVQKNNGKKRNTPKICKRKCANASDKDTDSNWSDDNESLIAESVDSSFLSKRTRKSDTSSQASLNHAFGVCGLQSENNNDDEQPVIITDADLALLLGNIPQSVVARSNNGPGVNSVESSVLQRNVSVVDPEIENFLASLQQSSKDNYDASASSASAADYVVAANNTASQTVDYVLGTQSQQCELQSENDGNRVLSDEELRFLFNSISDGHVDRSSGSLQTNLLEAECQLRQRGVLVLDDEFEDFLAKRLQQSSKDNCDASASSASAAYCGGVAANNTTSQTVGYALGTQSQQCGLQPGNNGHNVLSDEELSVFLMSNFFYGDVDRSNGNLQTDSLETEPQLLQRGVSVINPEVANILPSSQQSSNDNYNASSAEKNPVLPTTTDTTETKVDDSWLLEMHDRYVANANNDPYGTNGFFGTV